ncbi:MAG: hypothetical protein ACOYOK_03975 [Pseudobdellovibrionaceae bacterium]
MTTVKYSQNDIAAHENWSLLLDLSHEDLLAERLYLGLKKWNPLQEKYILLQIAYRQADLSELFRLQADLDIKKDHEHQCVYFLLELKIYSLQKNDSEMASVEQFMNEKLSYFSALKINHPLLFECIYSLGFWYFAKENFLEAKNCFQKSFVGFESLNMQRSAVPALQNFLACEINLHPHKDYMMDLVLLYRKARKLNMNNAAAMALLNLSRQMQIRGAIQLAYRYALQAHRLIAPYRSSLQYGLILAQKAHLLILLQQRSPATVLLEELKINPHPSIQKTALNLEKILLSQKISSDSLLDKDLPTSWRERLKNTLEEKKKQISPLEEKLLGYLSTKNRHQMDIIQFIYGESADLESAQNRFKNLLHRLRSKLPDLIIYNRKQDMYKLNIDL